MSILVIAGQHKKSKTSTISAQGDAKNFPHTVQGIGCARTSGWFLFESGRLVGAKCFGRWTRQLCISVECMHKSSECLRPIFFFVFFGDNKKKTQQIPLLLYRLIIIFGKYRNYLYSIIGIQCEFIGIECLSRFLGDAFMWFELGREYGNIGIMERTWQSGGGRYPSWVRHRMGCSRK